MAFTLTNWSRQSVALNTGEVDVNGVAVGGPALYTYRSVGDAIATIEAANYFASQVYSISVGDYIFATGSDASGAYIVDALDREAGTITIVGFSLTGAVDTADIVDGAVTNAKVNAAAGIEFSKLEDLTDGEIIVGSAADVPTAVAMSGDATIANTGAVTLANNAVTSAKLAATALKYTTVAISAAEFNGMYAAPKLLLAAGGANTLHVLDKLDLLMTYVSAAYAAGGVVAVQYDSTANGAGVIASSTQAAAEFQAAASTGFPFNMGIVAQTFSTCVNKGLYLSNITGAFTTGDSTFVAHLWYKTIPTV
jgi:hypothetical protein